MFDRAEVKARGKMAFKANYWKCVLIGLLLSVLSFSASTASSNDDAKESISQTLNGVSPAVLTILTSIIIVVALAAIAFDIFVANPLVVGCKSFFRDNRNNSNAGFDHLKVGFTYNYTNVVLTMFLTKLFIFLWTLLLIVPGIVKSYQYRFVEYLLAENPDMNYKDAMATSKAMMEGNKMAAFILDLSFLGWIILSVLTLGILGIFYVNPYVHATDAELYWTIAHKDEAFSNYSYDNNVDNAQTIEFDVE
mgnify:CR=1 FL=1